MYCPCKRYIAKLYKIFVSILVQMQCSSQKYLGLRKLIRVLAVFHSNLDLALLKLSTVHPQSSLYHITSHYRANTFRRACEHNVALLQSHDLRDIRQLPANAEQHQLRVVLLLNLTIDLQIKLHVVRVHDFARRNRSRNGKKGIEALRDTPRQALLLGFILDIATGHVDREQVAFDRRHPALGIILVDVAQSLSNHDSELDFVVEVHAARAEDWALVGEEDGGGGLEEEEGLLGALVVELLDMVCVVTANAHDLGGELSAGCYVNGWLASA
jgi:hypothetical protein